MLPTTHIIGAGLASLSAAMRLAEGGRRVALYEAANPAGSSIQRGACRARTRPIIWLRCD
jgi:uncharacterized protein with NAD-binding domain and iron-sulfur cluster